MHEPPGTPHGDLPAPIIPLAEAVENNKADNLLLEDEG